MRDLLLRKVAYCFFMWILHRNVLIMIQCKSYMSHIHSDPGVHSNCTGFCVQGKGGSRVVTQKLWSNSKCWWFLPQLSTKLRRGILLAPVSVSVATPALQFCNKVFVQGIALCLEPLTSPTWCTHPLVPWGLYAGISSADAWIVSGSYLDLTIFTVFDAHSLDTPTKRSW